MDRTVTLTEQERERISRALMVLRIEKMKAAFVAEKPDEDTIEIVNEIDAIWKKTCGEDEDGE